MCDTYAPTTTGCALIYIWGCPRAFSLFVFQFAIERKKNSLSNKQGTTHFSVLFAGVRRLLYTHTCGRPTAPDCCPRPLATCFMTESRFILFFFGCVTLCGAVFISKVCLNISPNHFHWSFSGYAFSESEKKKEICFGFV